MVLENGLLKNLDEKEKKAELAVIYDKNESAAKGLFDALPKEREATFVKEKRQKAWTPQIKLNKDTNYLQIKQENGEWKNLDGIHRHLTYAPWTRLPLFCKTKIVNHPITCLAGGRNKFIASHAYNFFNETYSKNGFNIETPVTYLAHNARQIIDRQEQSKFLVVKSPFANAGQDLHLISSKRDA